MLVGPVGDEALHALPVVDGHEVRESHVARDGTRHANLIARDGRVARDDSTSRKVDALTHEVPAHAAFLALDALADRLDRLSVAVLCLGLSRDLVVVHSRNVVLQELLLLLLCARRGRSFPQLLETEIGLDYVCQLEGDVVLATRPLFSHDRRTYMRRGHRNHCHHHPVWAAEARVEPKHNGVLVRDPEQEGARR